jgi:hypothetical protein
MGMGSLSPVIQLWCGVILQQMPLHPLVLPSLTVYTPFSLIRTFDGDAAGEGEIFSFVCQNTRILY